MNLGKWCTDLQEMPRKQDMGRSEMDFDSRHLTLLFAVIAASQGVGGHRFWLLVSLEKHDLTSW